MKPERMSVPAHIAPPCCLLQQKPVHIQGQRNTTTARCQFAPVVKKAPLVTIRVPLVGYR